MSESPSPYQLRFEGAGPQAPAGFERATAGPWCAPCEQAAKAGCSPLAWVRTSARYPAAARSSDPVLLSAGRLAAIEAELASPRARSSYVSGYGVAADVVEELFEHAAALKRALAAATARAERAEAEVRARPRPLSPPFESGTAIIL